MRPSEIAKMPTTITFNGCMCVHESILRSFQTLQFLKKCLASNWPSEAILTIIDTIEAK
jgi:hypothetical protein